MKVSLINIDSKLPNIALHKIAIYHEQQGDEVIWDMPIMPADKTYVSCIFQKNKYLADEWNGKAVIGGSGYSLDITLPDEIEQIKPHINYGFTTRGCIRKCKFCIVPQKEGHIRIVGDLLDLWDGKSKLVTMIDNNILALPEHFEYICKQAQENKIKIDFNQGLDHRLLTNEIALVMSKTPHEEYRFAFDDMSYLNGVDKAITILQSYGIMRCTWYVLVGFNTTFEQDLWRCEYLKKRGQNAFVQRYNHQYKSGILSLLARWANQHAIFHSYTWKEFCEHPKHIKTYKQYF